MWLENERERRRGRVPFVDESAASRRCSMRDQKTKLIKKTTTSRNSFEYFFSCTLPRYYSRTSSFSFGSMVLRHTHTHTHGEKRKSKERKKERKKEEKKNSTSSFVSICDYLIKWIARKEKERKSCFARRLSLLSSLCPIVIMTLCISCRWNTEDDGATTREENERSLTIYNRPSSMCAHSLVCRLATSIWFNHGASLH